MTKKRLNLLRFIAEYKEKEGMSPTFAEMVAGASLSSNKSIIMMLRKLRERGLITYLEGKKRTVSITLEGFQLIRGDKKHEEKSSLKELYHQNLEGIVIYGSGVTNESFSLIEEEDNLDISSTNL